MNQLMIEIINRMINEILTLELVNVQVVQILFKKYFTNDTCKSCHGTEGTFIIIYLFFDLRKYVNSDNNLCVSVLPN